MKRLGWRRANLALGALVMTGISCGQDHQGCPPGPVPPPAIEITVKAQGSTGPVTGAFVAFVFPKQPELGRQTVPCGQGADASICTINGEPGTYNLEVGAPGFITQQVSVTVEGSLGECSYTIFMTQRLTVVLQTKG